MFKKLGFVFEKFGPILLSIVVFFFLTHYKKYFSFHFSPQGGWKIDALYNAIFGWSSVQVGFVFGVYGFVIGKKDGFIDSIKNTIAMNRFNSYLRSANILGFLLAVTSLPLMVINPDISTEHNFIYYVVSLWFSAFIWAFLTFLRISVTFGILISVRDENDFDGA